MPAFHFISYGERQDFKDQLSKKGEKETAFLASIIQQQHLQFDAVLAPDNNVTAHTMQILGLSPDILIPQNELANINHNHSWNQYSTEWGNGKGVVAAVQTAKKTLDNDEANILVICNAHDFSSMLSYHGFTEERATLYDINVRDDGDGIGHTYPQISGERSYKTAEQKAITALDAIKWCLFPKIDDSNHQANHLIVYQATVPNKPERDPQYNLKKFLTAYQAAADGFHAEETKENFDLLHQQLTIFTQTMRIVYEFTEQDKPSLRSLLDELEQLPAGLDPQLMISNLRDLRDHVLADIIHDFAASLPPPPSPIRFLFAASAENSSTLPPAIDRVAILSAVKNRETDPPPSDANLFAGNTQKALSPLVYYEKNIRQIIEKVTPQAFHQLAQNPPFTSTIMQQIAENDGRPLHFPSGFADMVRQLESQADSFPPQSVGEYVRYFVKEYSPNNNLEKKQQAADRWEIVLKIDELLPRLTNQGAELFLNSLQQLQVHQQGLFTPETLHKQYTDHFKKPNSRKGTIAGYNSPHPR
ncbi:MAG: hypothetical protein ACOYK8_00290 [Alphaproteobacteria bacterium]